MHRKDNNTARKIESNAINRQLAEPTSVHHQMVHSFFRPLKQPFCLDPRPLYQFHRSMQIRSLRQRCISDHLLSPFFPEDDRCDGERTNGGCSDICLPNSNRGRKSLTCLCPTGIKLNGDDRTCNKCKSRRMNKPTMTVLV